MKILTRFLDIIDNINERIGTSASFLLPGLMLVMTYDVVRRYLVGSAIVWGLETDGFLLLAVIFLGGGYAFLHRAHVNVTIIYDRFSPRVQAAVDLFTHLIFFAVCIVLVWLGSEVTRESLIEGTTTPSQWAPPIWPSQILIPIGAVLIGLQGLAKWIRDWFTVVGVKLESKPISRGKVE